MVDLTPLEIRVTTDTSQAEAGLRNVGAAATTTSNKINSAGAGTSKLSSGLNEVGKASAFAGGRSRMLTQQLSQVAQQATATGQIGQAFAVQAADIGLAFGVVGTVVGALAGIALPSVIAAFKASRGESVSLEDALENLSGSLGAYREFAVIAATSTRDLTEDFGEFAGLVRETSQYMAQVSLGETFEAAQQSASGLLGVIGDVIDNLDAVAVAQGALDRAIEGQSRGILTADDVAVASDVLEMVKRQAEESAAALGLTAEAAATLEDSLRDIGRAKSLEEMQQSAAGALAAIQGVHREGQQLPEAFRPVVAALNQIITETARTDVEVQNVRDSAFQVYEAVQLIGGGIVTATSNAANLAGAFDTVRDSVAGVLANMQQMAIIGQAGTVGRGGAGPGGPMGAAELFEASTGGINFGDFGAGDAIATGGGGGVNPLIGDLEALQESLMTQEELLADSYASQLETLNAAREQELITEQQYSEAKLDVERQYQEGLSDMRTGYYGDALSQSGAFLGGMATALSAGNDKMLAISEKFAKAEAVVNAIRAYGQVAADPSLPWFAKIPAAIGVAAAVSSFASGLGGGGGGGGASGAGGSVSPEASASNITNINANIAPNANYQGSSVMELFEIINQASADGNTIRLRSV